MLTLEGTKLTIGMDKAEGLNFYAADSDLVLDCGEITEIPVRVNHHDITDKMLVMHAVFAEPSVQKKDLTCETFNGYLVIEEEKNASYEDDPEPAFVGSSNLILYLSDGPNKIAEEGRSMGDPLGYLI